MPASDPSSTRAPGLPRDELEAATVVDESLRLHERLDVAWVTSARLALCTCGRTTSGDLLPAREDHVAVARIELGREGATPEELANVPPEPANGSTSSIRTR